MSGEVTLLDTTNGAISHLVRTAAGLFAQPRFPPAALVGGLAVTIRLATVHRATVDVDAVTDGEAPRQFALEYLRGHDAGGSHRVEIGGVKVDVMATQPLPASASELPDGDLDRLFVLGHRWALETAEAVDIQVRTENGSAKPSSLIVATAPALIACKLHAIADRRGARSEKRESDAIDLVPLVADLVRTPLPHEKFTSAPFDLAALVTQAVHDWFVEDALRTARLITLGGGTSDAAWDPDDISTIGELFVASVAG